MKSVLIAITGSFGVWAAVDLSVALQVLIGLVTVGAIVYEKWFFKDRCANCIYYQHYIHTDERKKSVKGNKK